MSPEFDVGSDECDLNTIHELPREWSYRTADSSLQEGVLVFEPEAA